VISKHVPVVVLGAGAAGICAALASARAGAETLLVEQQTFVGGNSAQLPWLGFHSRDYRQVVKGMPAEFVRRLQDLGEASRIRLDPVLGSAVTVNTHAWRLLAMRLLAEAGVRVLLQHGVVDAIRSQDRIEAVVLQTKSGRMAVSAEVFVDASGDGDVAALAGVPWEKGRTADGKVQAPTLVFRMSGIDRAAFVAGARRLGTHRELLSGEPRDRLLSRLGDEQVITFGGFAELFERARRERGLDVPTSRVIGVLDHRNHFHAVCTKVTTFDPTDADLLAQAYESAYAQVQPLLDFFRGYVPGFAGAELAEIAPMLGVRESRRVMGDYVLTEQDVREGARFDDGVAMGAYHIDIHRPDGRWVESHAVRPYDIPYRCLLARGVRNLAVAGKCFSGTSAAVASTRVIPICMAQGQAAGTAAALAAGRGGRLREVDVPGLRARLIADDAELGQGLGEPDPALLEMYGAIA
jgi:glycine/D-amino acid oxidase-like deaminating enzyme